MTLPAIRLTRDDRVTAGIRVLSVQRSPPRPTGIGPRKARSNDRRGFFSEGSILSP